MSERSPGPHLVGRLLEPASVRAQIFSATPPLRVGVACRKRGTERREQGTEGRSGREAHRRAQGRRRDLRDRLSRHQRAPGGGAAFRPARRRRQLPGRQEPPHAARRRRRRHRGHQGSPERADGADLRAGRRRPRGQDALQARLASGSCSISRGASWMAPLSTRTLSSRSRSFPAATSSTPSSRASSRARSPASSAGSARWSRDWRCNFRRSPTRDWSPARPRRPRKHRPPRRRPPRKRLMRALSRIRPPRTRQKKSLRKRKPLKVRRPARPSKAAARATPTSARARPARTPSPRRPGALRKRL